MSPSGCNVSPPTGPRVQAFVRVKRQCEDDDKMSMIGMQEDLSPSACNVSPPMELRVPSSPPNLIHCHCRPPNSSYHLFSSHHHYHQTSSTFPISILCSPCHFILPSFWEGCRQIQARGSLEDAIARLSFKVL